MIDETNSALALAVLAERHPGESRVAVVPDDIARLRGKIAFKVERGAGARAGFDDASYEAAGATIVEHAQALASPAIVAVRAPEPSALQRGAVLISLGGRDAALGRRLNEMAISHLGLERMPRITRAQSMDVLSSQGSISGYAAVIEGARTLGVLLPMMTTAAGGIKPAKMIALGAGVAGLQAIATARRLGAVAHGFDVRAAAREQVESLGGRFVSVESPADNADAAGGYAAEQTAATQQRLREALAVHLSSMDLIITTAQVPDRRAPILIDDHTVAGLKPGAVVIDLAAESGGNCSLTAPDEVVERNGVRIFGPTNLPSLIAKDASRLFSGNIRALLTHLLQVDARLMLRPEDEITNALLGSSLRVAA